MAPSTHSRRLPQSVLRLHPKSESDDTRKEVIRTKSARENAHRRYQDVSAPSKIRVDIGPAYYPRFGYRKSWELESPERSEPGSPTKNDFYCPDLDNFAKRTVSTQGQKSPPEISEPVSPVESPVPSGAGSAVSSMTTQDSNQSPERSKPVSPTKIPFPSPTGSWATTTSTQSSTQTDEEATQSTSENTNEIDAATLRASNLSEQLLMERSKLLTLRTELDETVHSLSTLTHNHSILLKEHDNTKHLLWTTRHKLAAVEKQRKGLFFSEKLALVQAERDTAVLKTSELELKMKNAEQEIKEAERERDEALEVARQCLEEKEKVQRAKEQMRGLLAEVLEEKRNMRKEKEVAETRAEELMKEKEVMEKERDEARQCAEYNLEKCVGVEQIFEEVDQQADLLRDEVDKLNEEMEKLKGGNKAWGRYWYWAYFLGPWWE